MENVKPFKEMSFTEKKNHIRDYYKWHIIIAIILLYVIISIVHDILMRKDDLLNVLFINYPAVSADEDCNKYFEPFITTLGYDTKNTQVSVNNSLTLDVNSAASYQQIYTMDTLIMSGTYTGFFSDKDTFMYNADQDTFQSLAEYVPADILEAYGDAVIYVTSPEFHESYPCGIILTKENNQWLAQNSNYDSCYFGLCFSSVDEDIIQKFTNYLLVEHRK